MNPILVYGSKEFGQTVRALVEDCGRSFAGFIDDWHTGTGVVGSFADTVARFKNDQYDVAVAIGYNHLDARWNVYRAVKEAGYRAPALVHPTAIVNGRAKVGEGAMVMAGAVIDTNAVVEELAVVRLAVVVSHDSTIGQNTFLSPNSTVCGFCRVGRSCFIGAGAVIVDHAVVTHGAFVKAGTVHKRRA